MPPYLLLSCLSFRRLLHSLICKHILRSDLGICCLGGSSIPLSVPPISSFSFSLVHTFVEFKFIWERERERRNGGWKEIIGGIGCWGVGDEYRQLSRDNHGQQAAHVCQWLCFQFRWDSLNLIALTLSSSPSSQGSVDLWLQNYALFLKKNY